MRELVELLISELNDVHDMLNRILCSDFETIDELKSAISEVAIFVATIQTDAKDVLDNP